MAVGATADLRARADKLMGIFPDVRVTVLTGNVLMNGCLKRIGKNGQIPNSDQVLLGQAEREVFHAVTLQATLRFVP